VHPVANVAASSIDAAVSVAGLWKRYGATEAVRGISFEVAPGEIFGLLGPNGAGKTTTLECILGLRLPDSGSIRINGLDIKASRAKRLIGAQLQAAALQDKITPRQALELFGSFYPQSFGAEELLLRFDIESKADAAFATLSGGQKQRLFLALAVINRPAVLVLDEPGAGLDPQARRTIHSLIREVAAEGRTVLLSTHDLEEAHRLCGRLGIMDSGRLVAVASPAELIERSQATTRVTVRTAPPLASSAVGTLPEVTGARFDESGWVLETRAAHHVLADLVRRVDEAGAQLLDLELRRPSLEDVFIELTGRPWPVDDARGGAA